MFTKIIIMINFLIIFLIFIVITDSYASIDQNNNSLKNINGNINWVSLFNCKDKPKLSRFPSQDCTNYIQCVSGTPYLVKCMPEGSRFNPKTSQCDLPPTEKCGNSAFTLTTNVNKPIIDKIQMPTTTLKPPILSDKFSFTLDCGRTHPCGLYPNHDGDCTTFLLCTENGTQTTKHCHDGQHFDTISQECRPPAEATCWEEPNNGPFNQMRVPPPEFCPPFNNSNNSSSNNKVLATPNITNFGDWGSFQSCPNGSYISGINAWRRVLQAGSQTDQVGLVSIGVQCRNTEGVVTKVLQSVAPNAPNDGFYSFYPCVGVAVGFEANIKSLGGDNIATDNVQLICSCGPPAFKPYDNIPGLQVGHRGNWVGRQICGVKEALCGIQTQMQQYRERVLGQYDNTGLNNLKMKCCPVPDPIEICIASEKLVPIRSCINNQGIYPRRCDFEVSVGTGYDSMKLQSINFHHSVGYDTLDVDMIKRKLQLAFVANNQTTNEYSWEQSDDSLWTSDINNWMSKEIYLPVNTSVDIFQVVGYCGHFIVRTNRFLRINTDFKSTGNKTIEYFDI